jgi:hypothetical protein
MDERERLTGFILQTAEHLLAQDKRPSSVASIAAFRKAMTHKTPISGLRQAARDIVEWCQDLTSESVSMLDSKLAAAQLPTLSQMRSREYQRLQALLSQDRLRTAAEYELLENVLSDTAGTLLSEADRLRASQLLANYHTR